MPENSSSPELGEDGQFHCFVQGFKCEELHRDRASLVPFLSWKGEAQAFRSFYPIQRKTEFPREQEVQGQISQAHPN